MCNPCIVIPIRTHTPLTHPNIGFACSGARSSLSNHSHLHAQQTPPRSNPSPKTHTPLSHQAAAEETLAATVTLNLTTVGDDALRTGRICRDSRHRLVVGQVEVNSLHTPLFRPAPQTVRVLTQAGKVTSGGGGAGAGQVLVHVIASKTACAACYS
jgi:hypothetical protein